MGKDFTAAKTKQDIVTLTERTGKATDRWFTFFYQENYLLPGTESYAILEKEKKRVREF